MKEFFKACVMNSFEVKFSQKDSILNMWVILSPKNVKSHVENHVNDKYCKGCIEICLIIYLCARKDKSKNNPHSPGAPSRLQSLLSLEINIGLNL
jgi:hypothetical protein